MKKSAILVLVAASTIALCLALIPNAFSQPENVSVLSYSWYMSPYSSDYLIVIGEAQNTGSNVIDYITVTGTFYAADGTPYMISSAKSLATQILPQQKTPFYIAFSPYNIVTGVDWGSQSTENFTAVVNYAAPTGSRQYQDLTVTSHAASTDADGYYRVTGVVQNTGNQATNQTWVVATFYNSTGSVVAVGYTETYLTPISIPAGGTASFTIYPLDYTAIAGKIASYSLLIQTKLTAPSATPSPSLSPSTSPTPTAPSSSPTPTPMAPANGTNIPDTYVYAAVAVVIVVIAIGVVALVRRKRASGRTAISQK